MKKENRPHIVMIDDDTDICELVSDYLERYGYDVSTAHSAKALWPILETKPADLVILDVMMPEEDGLSLCKKLREQSEVPILMLSAAGEEADRILGLEIGADDYLTKPFSSRELLARIKSLLRRSTFAPTQPNQQGAFSDLPKIKFANWTLDLSKRTLTSTEGKHNTLTNLEFDLLVTFAQNAQTPLSRDQLMETVIGKEADALDRSVDVLVGRLRKKIEADPKQPKLIATVRGLGYQLDTPVQRE